MINLNKPAPDFNHVVAYKKGVDEFLKISLSDYKGKWLVFFFYPRDFTFVCPTELKGFAKAAAEFKELNCEILAISTDSAWSHMAWFERDLPMVEYPILADTTLKIAREYNVLNEENGDADRGLFIINPEGQVAYYLVSPDPVGRSVKETLRALKALQSGERCPVDWEEGQATLGKPS
jgi:peroxiredoxin (alkyl hydroperoxide reductase subunit C)